MGRYEQAMSRIIKQYMKHYPRLGEKARIVSRNGQDGFEVGRGADLEFIAFEDFWDNFSNTCAIDPETGELCYI